MSAWHSTNVQNPACAGLLQLPYASPVCNAVYYLKNTTNMYSLPKVHHHELCSPSKSHHVRRDYRVSNEFDLQVGPWSNKSKTKKQTGKVSRISLRTTFFSVSLWLPGENVSQSDDTVDSFGSIVVRNHLQMIAVKLQYLPYWLQYFRWNENGIEPYLVGFLIQPPMRP